ncbi:NOTCH2 [Branchiostoma lanceolatum]|uniref:NOTCH2 protein n=1 Tax=Branchiostoma lanceolatum TaxID=7740 RepID=A0A8K0AAW5_BRALA|nr:NOTCH2 [Branchiostoma lanceolatum]
MERRYGVDFRPKVSPEQVGPTKSAWPTYCDHLFTKGGPKSQYGRSGKRTKRKIRRTPSDPYEAPTRTKVSPFEDSSSSVSGVEDDLQSERSFYVSFDVDEESGFGSLPGTPEVPETERTSCCEEDQISCTTQDTTISDYCVSETSEDKDDVTEDHRHEAWEDVITKPNQEKPATDVFIPCAEITADIPEKRDSEASGPWRPYGPPGIPEILRRKEEKKKTEEDMRRLRKLILILASLSALALALAVSIVMGRFLRPEEPLPEWMGLFSFPGKSESFPYLRGDLLAIVAARRPPPIPPIISDCFNVSLPLSENGEFICSDVTYGPRLGQKYVVTFCVLSCDAGYHGEDAGLLFCDNSTWSPIAPEVLSALVGLGQAVDAVPRTESFAANLTRLNVNGTVYTRVTAGVMSRLDLADEVSLGSLEDSLSYFEYPGNGTIGDPYVLRQALSHTSPRLVGEVSGMNFTAALAQLDAFGASKNPTCKKVDCGDPRNPDNGSIASGRTEFGDVLRVSCDPGYEKSHVEIECLENGNWSEAACDPVDCGQPQNVSDGMHVCQGTTFTQTCHVTCDVGYVPVTSDELICSSSRKWMRMPEGTNLEYIEPNVSEVLSCERMACGNITVPIQGEVVCSGTRYNDTCKLSCAEGYIPTAGTQFTCDAAGNWTAVPECTAVECGDPPSFPNTVFECSTGTSFPHGCSASCVPGYRNTNYTHVTCGSHGNWTLGSDTDVSLEGLADDFFCERKDCGVLQEPNNGTLVCTGTRFEDTCQLTCDTGYEVTKDDGIFLFDEDGYTCTEAGTWSSQPTCGESDFCLHGHDDCDLQYGVCEHTGHQTYSCRCAQGTLGNGTSCAPPACGVLNATEPANGKLTCELQSSASSPDCRDGSVSGVDHQEYESVCSLTCNPGYKQTLDVSYMCLKNGDWHTPMDIGNGNVQPCVDIDECLSSPCRNNATCTNLENSYSCACVPGFTGTDCDEEINECKSDPCLNGGYCSDDVDSYNCSCLPGWTGEICQTDIDECSSSPCQHDGTCEDRVNGYTCHCTEGWEGEDCEINIDDCAGVTCQNDGRCDDHVSSYSCNCTGGWIGEHCASRAPSCAVLKDSGYTNSGRYVIDPDGPDTGMEPFSVLCDLDTGTTSVGHDSEDRTRVSPGCEAAGCYRREVQYNATLDQLSALVAVSNSCKQLFKYECYNSILGIAWWNSRGGQKQVNWAGSEADGRRCSCGISGTCADDSPTCNCDNNDNVWREDSGWLTDKNSLPVMQLNFGDTGDAGEDAFHTLGRFTCEGTKQ